MPDIEFVPESVDRDAEDGLSGGLPRIPARLVAILAVAIACAAAVLVTVRRHAPRPPVPQPSQVAVDVGSGYELVLGGSEPVLDVATVTTSSWVLRRDAIFVLRPGRPVARLALPAAVANPRLVADDAAGVVWLVANGLARAYNGNTLRRVFNGWAPPCENVAAMDGHLYVTNDRDVVEVGPGLRVPRHIATTPGPIAALAADATRHRLIAAYLGAPSRLLALVPQPRGVARVARRTTFDTNQPTLAVAAGQIWLAGYSSGNALVRLDPATLRPAAHTALGLEFGLGAYLAGAGAYALWVRGAGDGGELRCLNAITGQQLQSWTLSGRVASVASQAVVATRTGVVRLDLAGCTG